jgi:hypothetical protein
MSRLVRRMTFVLVALAAAATEVSAGEGRPLLRNLGSALVWVGVAAGLGWLLVPPPREDKVPPARVQLLLGLLAVLPFLVDPVRRSWLNEGHPLELQMVFALRNLGLGCAAAAAWQLCLRLACVASLFLTLFAVTMSDQPAVMALLGLYTAAGGIWLLLVYWSGLRRFFVTSEAVTCEVQPGREPLPWVSLFVFLGLFSSGLGLAVAGPGRAAAVLGEWLPTSGGTGKYDPFARGGVNDGDEEVRGENARSTGTIETDNFLDSPLPSLYDLISDLYGEPFKPIDQEQSIALAIRAKPEENNKRPGDNLRPNREFPTTRKSPRQPREVSDRAARALFEVQGRTPVHVRTTIYDRFDGISWRDGTSLLMACTLEKEPGSRWMRVLSQTRQAFFAESERHAIKITASNGSLVPTPAHLARFRVGRVDRADFFSWGPDQILCMAHRKTPSGIAVETESHPLDPRLLHTATFFLDPERTSPFSSLPPRLAPEVAALAHAWAGGRPAGWPQVAAILEHLREEYAVDPTIRVPENCGDPLRYFLLQVKRGPDYQFASAAVVLLRVLGYPARLVAGFYVAPDHYDPATDHTPVVPEDLHFWPEVKVASGEWLVLEPTPGYEVLGPRATLLERLWSAVLGLGAWCWRHSGSLALALAGCVGVWWRRRELLDATALLLWRWFPGRTWRQCVRRALWLLEWRGRWAGQPRRVSQTMPAWLRGLETDADLERLTRMAEWAAYAPDLAPPWESPEVRAVCRRILENWTLQRWRKVRTALSGVQT